MTTLKEILCAPDNRSGVVQDTERLVDSEVRSKGGLSGVAIKAGYKAVQAVKPTLVRDIVDHLLERFVDQLEPFYGDWVQNGKNPAFERFLDGRAREVANALLRVTDDKAQSSDHRTLKKTYSKLRPQGEKNVMAAVPGLARMLGRYVN